MFQNFPNQAFRKADLHIHRSAYSPTYKWCPCPSPFRKTIISHTEAVHYKNMISVILYKLILEKQGL